MSYTDFLEHWKELPAKVSDDAKDKNKKKIKNKAVGDLDIEDVDAIVLDESHEVVNYEGGVFWEKLMDLAEKKPELRFILVTGTP